MSQIKAGRETGGYADGGPDWLYSNCAERIEPNEAPVSNFVQDHQKVRPAGTPQRKRDT